MSVDGEREKERATGRGERGLGVWLAFSLSFSLSLSFARYYDAAVAATRVSSRQLQSGQLVARGRQKEREEERGPCLSVGPSASPSVCLPKGGLQKLESKRR
jgi:hypothetical protein